MDHDDLLEDARKVAARETKRVQETPVFRAVAFLAVVGVAATGAVVDLQSAPTWQSRVIGVAVGAVGGGFFVWAAVFAYQWVKAPRVQRDECVKRLRETDQRYEAAYRTLLSEKADEMSKVRMHQLDLLTEVERLRHDPQVMLNLVRGRCDELSRLAVKLQSKPTHDDASAWLEGVDKMLRGHLTERCLRLELQAFEKSLAFQSIGLFAAHGGERKLPTAAAPNALHWLANFRGRVRPEMMRLDTFAETRHD